MISVRATRGEARPGKPALPCLSQGSQACGDRDCASRSGWRRNPWQAPGACAGAAGWAGRRGGLGGLARRGLLPLTTPRTTSNPRCRRIPRCPSASLMRLGPPRPETTGRPHGPNWTGLKIRLKITIPNRSSCRCWRAGAGRPSAPAGPLPSVRTFRLPPTPRVHPAPPPGILGGAYMQRRPPGSSSESTRLPRPRPDVSLPRSNLPLSV